MAKGIGRLITVGIAKETTRGTAIAAPLYNLNVDEAEFDEKQEKVIKEQNFGVIEDSIAVETVKEWAEGSIGGPVGSDAIGLILYSAFGTLATTDNVDSNVAVKDHTFTIAQSATHQSLTLFVDDPLAAQDYKYALGVVSNLSIEYLTGEYVKYSADVLAKKGATATLTPTRAAETCFRAKHVTFKKASALAGLDAASALLIRSFKLNIEKNVEAEYNLSSNEPADFLNKQVTVTGEIEAIWQNESDFKTAFIAGTEQAFRIDMKNTDVTIGASASPELKIDMAKCIITEVSKPITNNDLMMQTVSFKAVYSTADTSMIRAVLTNIVASY